MHTFIWPDPDHVDGIGSKARLYQHLDLIASSITFTPRLPWKIINPGDEILTDCVVKRTHSDAAQHVILPQNVMPKDVRYRNWEFLQHEMNVPGCKWIMQSYSDSLKRLSEWRVIIVGRKIDSVIHTTFDKNTGDWTLNEVKEWFTLEELKYVNSISFILFAYLLILFFVVFSTEP
jgi:hypothetical protein